MTHSAQFRRLTYSNNLTLAGNAKLRECVGILARALRRIAAADDSDSDDYFGADQIRSIGQARGVAKEALVAFERAPDLLPPEIIGAYTKQYQQVLDALGAQNGWPPQIKSRRGKRGNGRK